MRNFYVSVYRKLCIPSKLEEFDAKIVSVVHITNNSSISLPKLDVEI